MLATPSEEDLLPIPRERQPLPRPFGNYELLEEIGRGGMGVVYRARQINLGRTVALKILPGAIFGDPQFIQRFRAEVQAAAALKHPNIVGIHEVGEHDGQPYFTMDDVEGQTLAALVAQRHLPALEAAQLLSTLALAVQFAHEHGVLHRDIKPSNILLDRAGQPHLADFGLAKRLESRAELTLTGQTLGSPNYIPPEQVSAGRGTIGPASDVYALGAVLYHLLTGRPPQVADTIHDTLEAVLHRDPVAPRLLNPTLPRDLETICLKCLAKEPAHRYDSAQALADDLARFAQHLPIRARPATPAERILKWVRRHPALATSAAVVAVSGLLIALLMGHNEALLRRERDHAVASEHVAVTTVTRLEFNAALSQFENDRCLSGLTQLAHLLRREPSHGEAVARLASALTYRTFPLLALPPLEHAAEVKEAHFSPDGRTIATSSNDGVARLWDGDTGQQMPTRFPPVSQARVAWISADGKRAILAETNGAIRLADGETGTVLTLLTNHTSPILFARGNDAGSLAMAAFADRSVRVWRLPSGAESFPPILHGDTVTVAEFNPNGSSLLTGSRDGKLRVWSLENGKPIGETITTFRPLNQAVFDPGGTRIASAAGDRRPLVWNASSGMLRKALPNLSATITAAAFSPDGMRLAAGAQDGTWQVCEVSSRQVLTRLVDTPGSIVSLRFSPDGERILVVADDRTAQVFDSQSAAPLTEPIPHASPIRSAEFSPDGTRLLTAAGTYVCLWDIVRVMKPSLIIPHASTVGAILFSPDGGKILAAGTDGSARLFASTSGLPLGSPMPHTPGIPISSIRFSADGHSVATASPDHTARVWSAASGQPLTGPLHHAERVQHVAFDSKGIRLVTASSDATAVVWNIVGETMEFPPLRHPDAVLWAEFTADSTRIVTTCQDGQVRFWNATTGHLEAGGWAHAGAVATAELSADGRRLLTGSEDGGVLMGNGQGQILGSGFELGAPITAVCFSSDAQWMLASSVDGLLQLRRAGTQERVGSVRFRRTLSKAVFIPGTPAGMAIVNREYVAPWALAAGTAAGEWWRHWGPVHDLAVSPDGRWVAVGGESATGIRLRELPPRTLPAPPWLAPLAEALAGNRFLEDGSSQALSPAELWRIQRSLRELDRTDDWGSWARWFTDLSDQRTVSRSSPVTRLEQARRCFAEESGYLHREAARWAVDQPRSLARLAIDVLRVGNRARFRQEANLLLRVAEQRDPKDPEIQRLRQAVEPPQTPVP